MKKIITLVFIMLVLMAGMAYSQTPTPTPIKVEIKDSSQALIQTGTLATLSYTSANSTLVIVLKEKITGKVEIIYKVDGVVQPVKSATIDVKTK